MARLSEYDCIGFDLDHTLIQYKLDNFYPFIYSIFAQALVAEKGYDPCLLEDNFEDLKDFCLRGLVLDIKRGNILKLGKDGFILRATHGTREMSKEELSKCYGEEIVWHEISLLKENPSQHSSILRVFESYFDLPVMVICARIVDIIDKKNGKPEEYCFWPDIISLFKKIFSPNSFSDDNGYYFPVIVKNTAKYIKSCSQKIVDWIRALRAEGKKVFLLTNSFIDYTNVLMNFAVGENWKELFDIVICMAGKPGFFQAQEQKVMFHKIVGEKEVDSVEELKEKQIYSRGNHRDLMAFLEKQTNKNKPKVLYFGDSLRSDLAAAMHTEWHVITVLEEMESEGVVVHHGIKREEENYSLEDGPNIKKPRYLIHDHVEIEKCKEEVLLSDQWGSFFCHYDREQNGDVTDCGYSNDNIMDGVFFCEKEKERREMNTFWGEVIEKFSTIAIPRIDFITELPLDYAFEPFNSSIGGFYPGSPKSLHL
ncbi:5'-nucleotidase domain-containing protein 1-like isoform X1 [Acropora palmata]|uniref:5'-nucleotidase domain-containing protein 1-like isoform X1 n=1 Tax=Acropora palmata TaxID=6131 RepID=UPI003DA14D2D